MVLVCERRVQLCLDSDCVIVQNGLLRCDEVTNRAPSTSTDSRLVTSSASDVTLQSANDVKSCVTSSDVTSTVCSQLPCRLQCHDSQTDPLLERGNKSIHDASSLSNCDSETSSYCAL